MSNTSSARARFASHAEIAAIAAPEVIHYSAYGSEHGEDDRAIQVAVDVTIAELAADDADMAALATNGEEIAVILSMVKCILKEKSPAGEKE